MRNYIIGDEYLERLSEIAISSTRMLKYKIDDIMDYSLLETNTIKINNHLGSLREMLGEVQELLNLQFDHSIIKFSVFVGDQVPDLVYMDHTRIKQVLINLIYNALKHTEKGFVIVIVD